MTRNAIGVLGHTPVEYLGELPNGDVLAGCDCAPDIPMGARHLPPDLGNPAVLPPAEGGPVAMQSRPQRPP